MGRQYLDRLGKVEVHYRDYILTPKGALQQSTSELEAEATCRLPAAPAISSSKPRTGR